MSLQPFRSASFRHLQIQLGALDYQNEAGGQEKCGCCEWHSVNFSLSVDWILLFNSFLLSSHFCDIGLSLVIHPLSLIIHPSLIDISMTSKSETEELIGMTPLRHLNQSVASRLATCHNLNVSCMEDIIVL